MDKKYNLKKKEKDIYNFWEKNNLFKPNILKNKKKNFSIIMPPPNITGNLHIGHAFQQTIMDIIIRYNKFLNKNTLWLMGTDHAGIATQILVENYIKKKYKKINKNILNKELLKWKKKYEKKINKQTKILGSSVDWSRTCFSLDKNFSNAVNTAFTILFKNKLIYKDKRIIHWDIKIKTVLSDLEIKNKKKKKKNYFIKFKILNKKKYLLIQTTKPEYILGITAIGINIKKKKYKKFINKYAINPINNYYIPIIGIKKTKKNKKYIKIIPGHNFNDFYIYKKYKLNIINIFSLNGFIKKKIKIYNYKWKKIKNNSNIKKNNKIFKNLNYIKVRKKIIKILKKKNKIKKIKKKYVNITYSNKSNSITIPIVTNQWYLKTKKLAQKSIKIIKEKKIKFLPKKYKNLFFYWMKNIKDWCISRQINWGHKIPVWYDKKNNMYVEKNIKNIKKIHNINIKKLTQDKNVLDTWFSSSLWSFASLGWPNKNTEFKMFHPIDIVISGYDIIFFWISRMIMMTLYLVKKKNISQIPFKKVFITGLIRDENGKKMSKSLGNVINPIDIINGITLKELIKNKIKNLIKNNIINKKKIIKNTKKKFPKGIKPYGIDALRFNLASLSTSKLTINFDIKKLNFSFNYCNKLWNACRYIYILLKKKKILLKKNIKIIKKKLLIIEYWIIKSLNKLKNKYNKYIKKLRFDLLCKLISKFLKEKFCDWYLESIKIYIKNKNKYKYNINILLNTLNTILVLSHPITPFLTEYFWQKFKNFYKKNNLISIMHEKILCINNKEHFKNKVKIKIFKLIKEIIISIRKLKNKLNIKRNKLKYIKLIILNINLIEKKYLLKNKYLFKIINIKKIFLFKIKNLKKNLKRKIIYSFKINKYNKKIYII